MTKRCNDQRTTTTKRMYIPYFRSIFMCTTLPIGGMHRNDSSIVNLDNADEPGTHWVAYAKRVIVLLLR